MRRDVDCFLVAGAAIAVYLSNLGNGFVYDDRFIIEQNPLVQNLDWWGLLTSSYWGDIVNAGLYRPLTLLSFGANRLFGPSPFGFHLVNDLMHAGVSVLVLLAGRALGASRFTALAAGLVFALHPLQTEAVDSIVGRAEILALGLALGAFVLFVRGGKPVWVGLLFFLALCSKESAAFAIALFALYWALFDKKNMVPLFAAALAYLALRFAVLGGLGIEGREIGFLDNPLADAPLGARGAGALILLANYAKLVVWPVNLSADYSFNQIPLSPDVRTLAGLLVVLAIGWIAWSRRGVAAFAGLAFLVPLGGFLHVLFPLGTLFAERLTYLPMFGAVLLIAVGVSALPRSSWILGIVLTLCALRVMDRNRDWHDNETLFRRTVETSPNSARSHFLLGAELLEQERYAEAAASFENGLVIAPQHVGARMSLGEALFGAGAPARALEAFADALERAPSDEIRERAVEAALAAGRASAREADWGSAERQFRRALEIDGRNVEAMNSLGLVAERSGNVVEAERRYESALDMEPEYVPAILNLASIRMHSGDLQRAEELFRRAVTLAPQSYEAYNGLGITLGHQGRISEAEAAFRRALRIDPSLDAARDNLRALGKTP